jgi:hypothetical protein
MTALGQKPEDGLFSINVCDRCKADQKITVNKPLLKIRSLGFFVKKCLALSVPHQF